MIFESDIYIYILGYIIIPIILFMSIKKYTEDDNISLSFDSTQSIRGICILLIILHHIVQRMKLPGLLVPYRSIGYILVTIFFFLSGYGLIVSLLNKNTYMNKFLINRVNKIYTPFVIVNIINIILDNIILGEKYNIKDIIFFITGIKLIDTILWYIVASLILYIIFYFSFYRGIQKYSIKAMMLGIVLYIFICIIMDMPTWWYNSVFGFPIGVIYGINKSTIKNNLDKKSSIISYAFIFVFIITFILANVIPNNKMKLIFEIISSILSIVVLICISRKINIKSKTLIFIGSISFEMYLIHMKLYKYYFNGEKLYKSYDVLVYIVLLIIVSLVFKNTIRVIFREKHKI